MPNPEKESENRFENIETPQELLRQVKGEPDARRNGFKHLSEGEMAKLRMLTRINPIAAQIFLFLMEHMNQHNAVACSQTLLAQITDRSRTTVHRAVVVLKEHHFIDVKKIGGTQVFHLDPEITWRSYNDNNKNIKYAELVAPILLDLEENAQMKNYQKEAGSRGILLMEETDK